MYTGKAKSSRNPLTPGRAGRSPAHVSVLALMPSRRPRADHECQ
jgi:hypothetical protein